MQIRIEYITQEENEIVIRCKEINDEINGIMDLLKGRKRKITGHKDGKIHILEPSHIYYCESVDNAVFAYTKEDEYKITISLSEVENIYQEVGFFRCSKSMVINLNAIVSLKSEMGNRIDATLKNREHIVISRHYAKQLREELQVNV